MTGYDTDYAPADTWPTLNVLDSDDFAAYNVAETTALDGTTLRVLLDQAGELRLAFSPGGTVEITDEHGSAVHAASIKEVDAGLFLVHYDSRDTLAATVLVLDRAAGVATWIRSTLVPGQAAGGLFAEEHVDGGAIDQAPISTRHQRTAELVGRRVQYVYGPDNAYEHIYLNENAYAWHCLAGAEKGLADVDRARVWKIRDEVYLLSWQEKVVPCDGIVVINFRTGQSTGRIWGYDTEAKTTNAIAMGARAIPLSHTRHDPATWAA